MSLAGQPIPLKDESRYLGVLVSTNEFFRVKATDKELKHNCVAACAATINQPFFDADHPNSTLRTFYRTNVHSILLYGHMLTGDNAEVEKLDRKMLNTYFKPIMQHIKAMSEKLIDRFCLRIRLP